MCQHSAVLLDAQPGPDPYHTTVDAELLTDLLSMPDLQVTPVCTADEATTAVLAGADLIVLWMLHGPGSEAAFARLRAQVERGTPLLCLHTALWCATPAGQAEALNGTYQGHPPYQTFHVAVDRPDHPVMAGVAAFEITDEAYQVDCGDDVTVLAHTDGTRIARTWGNDGGHDEWQVASDAWTRAHALLPLVFIKRLGHGWIVNQALGHDAAALHHPAVRRVITQAVRWLLARPGTGPDEGD